MQAFSLKKERAATTQAYAAVCGVRLALVKRQTFFAVGNPRMWPARIYQAQDASQNLNKLLQFMVSAMRSSGGYCL
jgi:hypothetical protein